MCGMTVFVTGRVGEVWESCLDLVTLGRFVTKGRPERGAKHATMICGGTEWSCMLSVGGKGRKRGEGSPLGCLSFGWRDGACGALGALGVGLSL